MSLQFRRDSEANITQFNPVLKEGEPLWDLDNKKLYIGDGVTNAVQLDSITGVTDSEVATVLNSLLTEGSSPNVNFVYDTGEDVFNISLDFAIPFDQEIRSAAGFVGSLIGDDSSTVFEASESAFVNLEEAFLTTVGPRTDNVFDIGSDTKRFSTGFFHNINVKDQSTVEDLNINGLIKSEDSSVLFDSRTNTLSASIIVGNLTGNVLGNDSTVLIDASTNTLNTERLRLNGSRIDTEFEGGLELVANIDSSVKVTIPLIAKPTTGGSILTASPTVLEITSVRNNLNDPQDIESGDIIGCIAFNARQSTTSTNNSSFVGFQCDPAGTTTATHVPAKFIVVSSPAQQGQLPKFYVFDSLGQMGIGLEEPQATVDINGTLRLAKLSTEPVSATEGTLAIADGNTAGWDPKESNLGNSYLCYYNGTSWIPVF